MKKLFTLLFLSGICLSAFAQKTNPVEIGINAGFNGAYITQGNSSYYGNNSDIINGFNVGFSAEYYFSDRWGLKGKVIYDQKGWGNGFINLDDGQGNSSGAEGVNFRLNYITVPVMANWHFAYNKNWYLNFGPYVGFLLSAKETNDDIDVKSAFNSTDFGFAIGIGVKIPVSKTTKLFFELEGQSGVTSIFADTSGPAVQSERSSLNIGFAF